MADDEKKTYPPAPVTDDKAHVTVTEGQKTILGTGGPQPNNQDGPIQFRESE